MNNKKLYCTYKPYEYDRLDTHFNASTSSPCYSSTLAAVLTLQIPELSSQCAACLSTKLPATNCDSASPVPDIIFRRPS